MATTWEIVIASIGVFMMVFFQLIPQLGLSFRPFHSKSPPGAAGAQQPLWVVFVIFHLGFSMVWGCILYRLLVSKQDGDIEYTDEAAVIVMLITFFMVFLGHLGLGIICGEEKMRSLAMTYPNRIPFSQDNGGTMREHLAVQVHWSEGVAIAGYFMMGVMNAFVHKHDLVEMAVIGPCILLPTSEFLFVRFQTKLADQYETPGINKCWGAEGVVAYILYPIGWAMTAWAVGTNV